MPRSGAEKTQLCLRPLYAAAAQWLQLLAGTFRFADQLDGYGLSDKPLAWHDKSIALAMGRLETRVDVIHLAHGHHQRRIGAGIAQMQAAMDRGFSRIEALM